MDDVTVRTPCLSCRRTWLTEVRLDRLRNVYVFRVAHVDQYVKQEVSVEAAAEPGLGNYVIGLCVEKLAEGTKCLEFAEAGPPSVKWLGSSPPPAWATA